MLLDVDNILDQDEANAIIFDDKTESNTEDKKDESIIPEIKFDNELDQENTDSEKSEDSPTNIYSSIASALKEDGIFLDLKDEDIKDVTNPEKFAELFEKQIQSKLDERQKRIDEALNVGVEPDDIKKYENTINYLDSIKEDTLRDESEQGEKIRTQLLMQDFLNKGFSKERAERNVAISFKNGTDIEDALEALNSNKDYFKKEYNDVIQEQKNILKEQEKQRLEKAETLKKSILNEEKIFDIKLDSKVRQKIYDNIAKPSFKDPKTGEFLTPVQEYERNNKEEFIKKIGLIFTLTNGFKDLSGLTEQKVSTEVKKGIRNLEKAINNTNRLSDGSLNFLSGVSDDPESSTSWKLDV